MLTALVKRIAARLSHARQQELKRSHFRRAIESGRFKTDEPEWSAVDRWLSPGDWAIDVGANVGQYTKKFSDLVGASGRVIAFEPVPATFELLAANAARFEHPNVTLLNLAASDATRLVSMDVPRFDTGLANYYMAAITSASTNASLRVLACPIDSLSLPGPVRVLKIDAEGHDSIALHGARALIERDRPTVIVESMSSEAVAFLESLGYSSKRLPGSSNTVFRVLGPAWLGSDNSKR